MSIIILMKVLLSWYDFARAIMDLGEVDCKIKPIETKDYPTWQKDRIIRF